MTIVPAGVARERWVAMGDPQAPLEKMMAILDAHDLLGEDGQLTSRVGLVSMGDHFDFGTAPLAIARADGLAFLSWLVAHCPDQVVVIAGNHDLGRVGELAGFDDETFASARELAMSAYESEDAELERELLRRYPSLPTAELAARDFSAFTVAQRELVTRALRARRMVPAHAHRDDLLLLHAGVTHDDLATLGSPANAMEIAVALNDALATSSARLPLRIDDLHEPGDALRGEGGGVFYHRPTSRPVVREPMRRRFNPRTIPRSVTQVIGHIADEKCRELMPEWSRGEPALGRLRTLVIDAQPSYEVGVRAGETRIVFTDAQMNKRHAREVELLDLNAMAPLTPIGR